MTADDGLGDADRPLIQLDTKLMFCARHLEPFRPNWPAGYPFAMIVMFQAFTARDDIVAYCAGDTARLQDALREFGPVCCLIGPPLINEIVDASLTAARTGNLDPYDNVRRAVAAAAGLDPDALINPPPADA